MKGKSLGMTTGAGARTEPRAEPQAADPKALKKAFEEYRAAIEKDARENRNAEPELLADAAVGVIV